MIDVKIACDQLEALLRAEIDEDVMAGYVGEVVEPVPTPPNDDRVKAYWALWPGVGVLEDGRLVPGTFVSSLNFVLTVAGGTHNRVLFGVEQVRKALAGIEIASGLISEQPFDAGPVRLDLSITPARHFIPLSYRLEP